MVISQYVRLLQETEPLRNQVVQQAEDMYLKAMGPSVGEFLEALAGTAPRLARGKMSPNEIYSIEADLVLNEEAAIRSEYLENPFSAETLIKINDFQRSLRGKIRSLY